MSAPARPAFIAAEADAAALEFDDLDGLAAHVHALRRGRAVQLLPQACFRGDDEGFPALAVFAAHADGSDDWLGVLAGPGAADLDAVMAALRRTHPRRAQAARVRDAGDSAQEKAA